MKYKVALKENFSHDYHDEFVEIEESDEESAVEKFMKIYHRGSEDDEEVVVLNPDGSYNQFYVTLQPVLEYEIIPWHDSMTLPSSNESAEESIKTTDTETSDYINQLETYASELHQFLEKLQRAMTNEQVWQLNLNEELEWALKNYPVHEEIDTEPMFAF